MNEENNTRPEHEPIPHELVSEILTRLPVKSLTRFRSVSTRWNSTITHPSFTKTHFRISSAASDSITLILTFINRFTSERTIFSVRIPSNQTRPAPNPTRLLTIPGFAHPFVSQSLNGIVCLNLGSMCVCNPSTRKFIKLPWTASQTLSPTPVSRHRSNHFGFDPVSSTHKVLDTWITCHNDTITMEHRVFTIGSGSGSGSWRRIAGNPPYFPFNESVCLNGNIYFRAFPSMIASEKPIIVVFDVNREEFRFIQMIDDPVLNSEETALIEFDGCLTIVDHQGVTNCDENVLIMWILMDGENEWVKKCVTIPVMYGEIKDRRRFKFAGTTLSGEMIYAEKRLVKPFCVVLHDIKKNEVKKVEIVGLTDFEFSCGLVLMNVNEHVESIMSLT